MRYACTKCDKYFFTKRFWRKHFYKCEGKPFQFEMPFNVESEWRSKS